MGDDRKKIAELVVARFLCKRNDALTWVVSPKAAPFIASLGEQISEKMLIAPSDEWVSYKDLTRHERMIQLNREYFQELMVAMVEKISGEIDRFVFHVRPQEFRLLLVYAGQDVYDFFARDHRFGAPPRGKIFRTNVRKTWDTEREHVKRPDMAIVALKRKIRVQEALGADVTMLEVELKRREDAIARGEDPLAGQRRYSGRKSIAQTPKQALEVFRATSLGLPPPKESSKAGRRWSDR